jgi:S-adenosylmethionine-diacylglycerol 3-amino-3-carboxypropyl transferase
MSVPYNFGQSQEDERTEVNALQLNADDHVISIASAGDMPLSLAAMGTQKVTAVDIDPAQLALTRLKLAAVRQLSRDEAIGFLGYFPMDKRQRKKLYTNVRAALLPNDHAFWDRNGSAINKGVIWAGRFERYLRYLRFVVVGVLGRRNIAALFECGTIEEQQVLFDRSIGRPIVRRIFRFAFNPKRFSGRGMDPRSLAHRNSEVSLGDQYFAWFRSFCTSNLASENYFLQLSLLGRVLDTNNVPAYLSLEGYEMLRSRKNSVVLYQGDIVQYLKEIPPASFEKSHLSNICDWMEQDSFENVMQLMVSKSSPKARIVWRFLHVDRSLPSELESRIIEEREFGKTLRKNDRYPFYTIVPAQISN